MEQDIKLIKIKDVLKMVPYSQPSLYRLIGDGVFPAPVKMGGRAAFWIEAEVNEFIQKCIDDRG